MGKTYANRWLLSEALRRDLVQLVIVHDDKGPEPQYPGTCRVNPAHLRRQMPSAEFGERDDWIIFRGHTLRTGESCGPDELAELAFEVSLLPGRPRALVSIDELRRAVSPAGREWRAKDVPRLFTEGGGLGVSVTWTTQSPQRIPVEAFDQSETLGLFRCGPRAVAYLQRAEVVDPDVLPFLPDLAAGEFVLVETASRWDGRIYRAPALRA